MREERERERENTREWEARAREREREKERRRHNNDSNGGFVTTTTAMGASWAWTGAPARHRRPGEDRRGGCTCSTVVRRGTARGATTGRVDGEIQEELKRPSDCWYVPVCRVWSDFEDENEGEDGRGPEGSDLAAEEGCCGMPRSGGE